MAKIAPMKLKFAPSPSGDVVSYKLYIETSSKDVNYSSPSFDLGKPNPVGGVIEVNMAELAGITTYEGNYNLGVTAVDEVGNESAMSVKNDVALDFVPPEPPGEIVIVRQ